MVDSLKYASPERDRTDRSLGDERRKADAELAKESIDVDEDADALVAAARERADDILARARASADVKLESAAINADARALIDDERCREDGVVQRERAIADDDLYGEREARRRALTALLALERTQTDEHLRTERYRMDGMVGSRDDFLGVVSHDLRNLLGSIAMSAETLLRSRSDVSGKAEVEREARRIQRSATRMTRLVSDLLDIVSIEAGRFAVAPERHDASDILGETLDAFRPLASVKQISMTSDVRAGSLVARYDYDRILQVLANLVGNAIKFTGEGGKIDLVLEAVGGDVRFAVRDNGPGIDSDNLGVIFERFWQVNEQRRTGLGLGLYISKCIIEAHGGRIWGESERGVGSTFFFTLPAASRDLGTRH